MDETRKPPSNPAETPISRSSSGPNGFAECAATDTARVRSSVSAAEVLDDFEAWVRTGSTRTRSTAYTYRRQVTLCLGWLRAETLEQIQRVGYKDLMRYLDVVLVRKGWSANSRRLVVTSLREFFGFLCTVEGVISVDPARLLKAPKPERREVAAIPRVEMLRIIFGEQVGQLEANAWQARNRVLVGVAYALGLRASEVGQLRMDEVLVDDRGKISFNVRAAKHSQDDVRMAVRSHDLVALLALYLEDQRERLPKSRYVFPSRQGGGALSARQVQRIVQAQIRKAGVRRRGRRWTAHSLRVSLITHMIERGESPRDVQQWARHQGGGTTLRYVHHVSSRGIEYRLFGSELIPKPTPTPAQEMVAELTKMTEARGPAQRAGP